MNEKEAFDYLEVVRKVYGLEEAIREYLNGPTIGNDEISLIRNLRQAFAKWEKEK